MPVSLKKVKADKKSLKQGPTASQLDIVFVGPLLFVPKIDQDKVVGVEVYAPRNGHPMGATFVPDVIFTDAELNDPQAERWPEMEGFSFLDPHSYLIDITQTVPARRPKFAVTEIPATNHKIKAGRKLSSEWSLVVGLRGQLAGWSSHLLEKVKEGVYIGSDAPVSGFISCSQRLSYRGVTAADFMGASTQAKQYLDANISRGGTLIVTGEIPFQPSLLHDRQAIEAIAQLAGLDLQLAAITPQTIRTRVTGHLYPCYFSIILI